jgi:NAD(P)H-hydrate epimerase
MPQASGPVRDQPAAPASADAAARAPSHAPAPVLSVEEARALDRWATVELGLPGLVLMENAGAAAARAALQLRGSRLGAVWILTGGGNNGGDGWVAARHLALAGVPVRILAAVTPAALSGDALVMARAALGLRLPCAVPGDPVAWSAWVDAAAVHAAVVVDALLGTGARGAPRGAVQSAIEAFEGLRGRALDPRPAVLALDVPSGLDADTGVPADAVLTADRTLTFAALKRGLLVPGAARYVGALEVASIGVPVG